MARSRRWSSTLPEPKSINTQLAPSLTMYTLHVSSNRYRFSVSLRGPFAGANPLRRRFFSVAAGTALAAAIEPADFRKMRRVSRGMANLAVIIHPRDAASFSYSVRGFRIGKLQVEVMRAHVF